MRVCVSDSPSWLRSSRPGSAAPRVVNRKASFSMCVSQAGKKRGGALDGIGRGGGMNAAGGGGNAEDYSAGATGRSRVDFRSS